MDSKSNTRTCDTYGLPICLDAQFFIKINAVFAVVCLLIGAIGGLFLGLTRWTTFHLLGPMDYYWVLTVHGVNMLIFWILFMEVAILYFCGTTLLKQKLASKGLAWLGFILMVVGFLMVDVMSVMTWKGYQQDFPTPPLMTSYVPLKAHPCFYLGLILFAVGVLVAIINFFWCIYNGAKEKTFGRTMPLVAFGACAAAIIGVFTVVSGAIALVPTFAWSMGWIENIDAAWYRLTWWGLGHSSQQVNVCAMVAVWYFLATLTTGAKPLNQAVCRGAFVLYILFICMASAHHLLVDPGVSATWKIWNTSYAMYLAVLASLVHGFTVPGAVEVAMRARGATKGLFSWITAAPWRDPGFSGFFLSLVIFGFLGGITGVTLGTQQINIMAHNTLRIPGHFHTTVAGGTTLAFMALTYYVVPLIFQKKFYFRPLCRIQPYLFAVGITVMSLGMSFAGSYGVPRRHYDVEFANAPIAAGFDSGAIGFLSMLGIGAVITFIAVMLYVVLVVLAVFFGESNKGMVMDTWQSEGDDKMTKSILMGVFDKSKFGHRTPGTVALVIVLMVSFVIYYFANWKALADVWYVR